MSKYYVGQRLSFEGARCTVRYFGPVEDTKGDWVGVEWDDPQSRGKHDGTHHGKAYFKCFSNSCTAASFIRPTRPSDEPLSFCAALRKKYGSNGEYNAISSSEEPIKISSKTVEEVGFEKIRRQQATLQDLPIVSLEGLCLGDGQFGNESSFLSEWHEIRSQSLKIVELDLSWNLLEQWAYVVCICSALRQTLRSLSLNGNAFRDFTQPDLREWTDPFLNVTDLSLASCCIFWPDIIQVLPLFPSLTTLCLTANALGSPPGALPNPKLENLDLSDNNIISLTDLREFTNLPSLTKLSLRNNPIQHVETSESLPAVVFPTVTVLDLTATSLPDFSSLDAISNSFPSLTALLTKDTPLTINLQLAQTARLTTIARLSTLTALNHTQITAAERQNAEMYYVSTVTVELALAANEVEKERVLANNPRYRYLCAIHDAHSPPETSVAAKVDPAAGTLATRMINLTFYITEADLQAARDRSQQPLLPDRENSKGREYSLRDDGVQILERRKLIPRSVDIYRLKGIVGRLFDLKPMECKLVWETPEWDPISEEDDDDGWSVSESEDEDRMDLDESVSEKKMDKERDWSKWRRREIELVDGTREVGFWVEGGEARVRVENRSV